MQWNVFCLNLYSKHVCGGTKYPEIIWRLWELQEFSAEQKIRLFVFWEC